MGTVWHWAALGMVAWLAVGSAVALLVGQLIRRGAGPDEGEDR